MNQNAEKIPANFAIMGKQVDRTLIVIVALSVVFLFYSLRYIHVNVDDQYMVFRYAVNLARGDGFTFSPGQRVEGYSCFSYVVLLSGLFRLFGLHRGGADAIVWMSLIGKIVGAIAGIGTISYLVLLMRRLFRLSNGLLFLSVAPVVLCIDFAYSSTNGLETGLVMLSYAGMASHMVSFGLDHERAKRHLSCAVAWACGLILTRADGALLSGLFMGAWLALHYWFQRPTLGRMLTRAASIVLPMVLVFVGYGVFRWVYFHDLFPNTYYMKFLNVRWNEALEVHDFWNWNPEVIRAWQRIPRTLNWYIFPSIWGYLAVLVFFFSNFVLGSKEQSEFQQFFSERNALGFSRLQAIITLVAPIPFLVFYIAKVGGDWMPGHRVLMHFMPPVMTVTAGICVHFVVHNWKALTWFAPVVTAALAGLWFGTAYTSEYIRDKYVYAALYEFGHGQKIQGGHSFEILKGKHGFAHNFTMYEAFMADLAKQLKSGDTVAFYESGYASLSLGEGVNIIDMSGLNDKRMAQQQAGEVYTPEMIRTYYTCGDSGGAKGDFVVSKHPKFVVFDTFQLRWCKRFPRTIFNGTYRLIDMPHNELGFYSVYVPVQAADAAYGSEPKLVCSGCK